MKTIFFIGIILLLFLVLVSSDDFNPREDINGQDGEYNIFGFDNITIQGNLKAGSYNWTVNDDNTSEYISFDGSVLSYTTNNLEVLRFYDGMLLETINVSICADSACTTDDDNVKLIVQANPVGDLTADFSSGFTIVDTTPAIEVNLTAGSNTSPQMNFIYILESTGLLTVSTSGFPNAEFAPIAEVLVPSVARVVDANVYKLHAWTDHAHADNEGHLSHLNSWIRSQPATWQSGVTSTLTRNATPTPDSLLFSSTSGTILQLHEHIFSAISAGQEIHVINDDSEAYKKITDLNEITTDSDGDSLTNKHYKLTLWGAVGENAEDNEIFLNLPSCSYTKAALAFADNDRCANSNIPSDYTGVGFLIVAYTISNSGGGNVLTIANTEILLGLFPSSSPGGSNAFVSEFADNTFTIFDEGDATKELTFNLDDMNTGTGVIKIYEDNSINLSNGNITVNIITASESRANSNWTFNMNYPTGCPGSGSAQTYISDLDDNTTCTGISDLDGTNIQDIYLLNSGDDSTSNYTFASIDLTGEYIHQGNIGFTGTCVNTTYSGGIAISCND